jgi:hypothetical protein
LRDWASNPKALAHGTLACGLPLRGTGSSTRFDAAAQKSVVSTLALPAASNLKSLGGFARCKDMIYKRELQSDKFWSSLFIFFQ